MSPTSIATLSASEARGDSARPFGLWDGVDTLLDTSYESGFSSCVHGPQDANQYEIDTYLGSARTPQTYVPDL